MDDPKFWVALFTLVVSAVFAIVNLRQVVRSIRGQTYQRVYAQMIDIDRFFFDHSDYKAYFYPDSGDRNPSIDPVKLASVTEMMADYFDSVYYQRDSMPPVTFLGFQDYMRSVYSYSPQLQDFIKARERWYPPAFLSSLRERPGSAAQG